MPDQPRTFLDRIRDIFGKPSRTLPTPNVEDFVVVESFTQNGNWVLPYGTPHPSLVDATGAPLTLIKQDRTPGNQEGQYVITRLYANQFINQDAYNAAISFTAQSTTHRIFSRSSLVLRSTYQPVAALSPDSVDPTALCTQESHAKAEDPYGNLYERVTRLYESMGSLADQDQWNRQDSLPYVLATYPRIVRRYRVPANNDPIAAGALVPGVSVDSAVPSALLLTLARTDESVRVRVYTATFESVPPINVQAGVGQTPGGIVALGVSVAYPESPDFPVLSWSFREFKSQYVQPTQVNQACPIPGYTSLVQTDEKAAPDEENPLILIVTREYQILPGYIVTSTDAARLPRTLTEIPSYYLNGDLLTTTEQKLPAFVNGQPTVADNIQGSLTLLSSKIEPHGKWYVVKTNISRADSTLPVAWQPKQVAEADGADGVEYKMLVQVTDPSTLQAMVTAAITTIKGLAGNLIDYHSNYLSPIREEIVYTIVNTFPYRVGQDFNAELGVALPFSEQIMTVAQAAALSGNPNTSITPLSGQDNLVRVRVNTPPTAYLDAYLRSTPTKTSVYVPEVLTALLPTFSWGYGDGSNIENSTGSALGNSGTVTLNCPISSEGSASIEPNLTPSYAPRPQTSDLDATDYLFYQPYNQTLTQILAALSTLLSTQATPITVLNWPRFKEQVLVFTIQGQRASVRANAQARISISFSSSDSSGSTSEAQSQGGGTSVDFSNTIRTLITKPAIFTALSVSPNTMSKTATATAQSTLALGAYTADSGNQTKTLTATASISPISVSVVGPNTSIPTSGLYAVAIDVRNSEFYGRSMVRVRVIDASIFA